MLQKKKNLLEKIVKKDYNNELEKILEQKQFDENSKSILLSILYKIEAAYKDLEIVKKDVETKEEYIENIFNIIKEYCDSIEIIKMSDKTGIIPDNKTYIINKEEKQIISYPIERKLLYAIAKIGKKEKIVKDEYFIINETLSNLINVGNNINIVEPLRDFNGYSWSTIPQEIESVDYNLVYQILRMLIGNDFLNKWIKNNEFIIDYFDLFKEKLEKDYSKKTKNEIIDTICKISILLTIKFNKEKQKEYELKKIELEEQKNKIDNKEEFIKITTKEKIEIIEKIKQIDTTINSKELLEKEYIERNKKLSIEKKIFSMKVLAKIMEKERDEYIYKLEELNKLLNPQNFLKYKKELETKYEYLKILDIEDKDNELDKLKMELQNEFLNMLQIKINKIETKQEIEEMIYNIRYYLLLPYNYEKQICEISKIQKKIEEVLRLVIDKAIEFKKIEKISEDKETNYEILKNLFKVRIIKLEDAYLKLTKDNKKYVIQIFDENIFEEKFEISKLENLDIKLNKKIAIWC